MAEASLQNAGLGHLKNMLVVCLTCTMFSSPATSLPLRFQRPAQMRPQLSQPACGTPDVLQQSRPPQEQWYCQQQRDHFDPQESATWGQRYFANETFFKGSKGPVFLCVGGETPLTAEVVISGSFHCGNMMVLAAQYGALVLALEHRYYGASFPVVDLSTHNLRWLSSQQALADLAQFHSFAVETYGLSDSNPWVSFGGSYPGMMAAWSRLKFPHLIHAAVASSAPVQASVEMQGYYDVVGAALALESIGGSLECQAAVKESFSHVGKLLGNSTGRQYLLSQFNVCNSTLDDTNDQMTFTELLGYGVYSQENDPSSKDPSTNLAIACSQFMTNVSIGTPIQRLVALSRAEQDGACLNPSYEFQQILPLQNRSIAAPGAIGVAWTYQTCTEFGFYQTCDPNSQCPFTSTPWLNTVQSYLEICKTLFAIDANTTKRMVDFSNAATGGWHPKGSRVLWVNGQADPWHALSVQESLPQMPSFMVAGASHHFWTHPPLPTDPQPVVEARSVIRFQIEQWLSDDDTNATTSSSNSGSPIFI